MSSRNVQNPKPEEKVCWNCKNLAWKIGIGLGISCHIRKGFKIPSIKSYTCEKFQYEVEPVKKVE